MLRYDLFRFIAFNLEKVGEPKDDLPTIFGITKKYYPKFYDMVKKAYESGNKSELVDTIISVYEYIYEHGISKRFAPYFPLNFNVFDMEFNKGPNDAIYCWQMTYNYFMGDNAIEEDGKWGRETESSLHILDHIDINKANDIYAYSRIERYMATTINKSWVGGLINRVIRLQKHILKIDY